MPNQFENINDLSEHYDNQFAEVRGEALAGRILAVFALDAAARLTGDPGTYLANVKKAAMVSIDGLKFDTPGDKGLGDVQKETARKRCGDLIDQIATRLANE